MPGDRVLARSGMRVIARVLDTLMILLIWSLVAVLAGGSTTTADGSDADGGAFLVVALINLVVAFVLDPVLTRYKGGSPMKLAFRFRVVRADDGLPVGWSHAIRRWLVPMPLLAIPLGLFAAVIAIAISLAFIFTKPLRQAVWDLIGKTIVVTAP